MVERFFSRRWIWAVAALFIFGLLLLVSLSRSNPDQNKPKPAEANLTPASTALNVPADQSEPTVAPTPTALAMQAQQGQAPLNPPPGIGDEYLALGDSVAYGVGAPFPEQLGYAGVFYDAYLRRVKPDLLLYKNFAIPGETSTSFITRTRNISQLGRTLDELDAAEKAGRRISPLTLTIGGNDMLDARNKTQAEKNMILEKYDSNLQYILSQLMAHTGGKSDLIVTTYYNPYAYNTGGTDEETAWVQRFNDTIKKRATEAGARVADFFTPIFGKEKSLTWIAAGDIHPTTPGHALLASVLWRTSGYDSQPPALMLSSSALPADNRLIAGQRVAFKVMAQDSPAVVNIPDSPPGAGSFSSATVTLDGGDKSPLAVVPGRYSKGPNGSVEYSYLLDTSNLSAGKHILRFEATDMAANTGSLDVTFTIDG